MKPINPREADDLIFESLCQVEAIDLPLLNCAGKILRENIHADRPFPPFNRAMMDGYAIRSIDLSTVAAFDIIAELPAGAPPVEIGNISGGCIEIMTGAVVPSDSDCIIPYELTNKLDNGQVALKNSDQHNSGDFIHTVGSDQAEGTLLLEKGSVLGSREIAIAATCGHVHLKVSKMPSITIVSTGDELVDIKQIPLAHQIRRSNDVAIVAALCRSHINVKESVHLPDDLEAVQSQLQRVIQQSDFVIISGGISMGNKDYVPAVLDTMNLEKKIHGVAQKPGKPFGFWSSESTAIFALPGNPLSALVCLHRYVLPALRVALGQSQVKPSKVLLVTDIEPNDRLTRFLPVKFLSTGYVALLPPQNSGDFVSILGADGFIELQPSNRKIEVKGGEPVNYYAWL